MPSTTNCLELHHFFILRLLFHSMTYSYGHTVVLCPPTGNLFQLFQYFQYYFEILRCLAIHTDNSCPLDGMGSEFTHAIILCNGYCAVMSPTALLSSSRTRLYTNFCHLPQQSSLLYAAIFSIWRKYC